MSKLVKFLSAFAVIFVGLLTLTSCGYNFYKDWSEAGAEIEKSNVFEAITLEEAAEKIESKDSFVLVIGCSESQSAVTSITTIQSLADYYEYEGKLQFIDATDYISLKDDRDNLKNTLGIKESVMSKTANIIMVIYDKGEVKLDSSLMKYDSNHYEDFQLSGSLNVNALASYIFTDYNAE